MFKHEGFSRRLWNHDLPLPDRCKLARYMWITEDVTLNNKRQHVFDWIIKTLTNNEKELLAEEYHCIWTFFVEIIRLPDEELGLLQAYVIPLPFMKIFCRTLRSISADVSGPIDGILLECAHLLINAGSRTHLLINNHNLMFGIVKKTLECATHSLCERTQMDNNVLALLKRSISMALVTQRQNTEYLKIFSYVMAELLELSLTYFYLADELNDISHLEREVIDQIQNCSQTWQQLLHNVIFHSDFYASHKIYIDKKHEREVKGEMFLGAKKKRGVEMLDNFYCKLGEWCRDTSNTTRHKSTLHYISMYITQYYTVYKSDPTMLNYDIIDFLCTTCFHVNPSPDVEVEDLGAKYVEQHPDDVDFEKNIESDDEEEEESLEPVTKKLKLEGSTNTENMLGDLWVNEAVDDDTFYELLPDNAEVASMDSDNTIQVNYTITDDVFESFLQLLKSTCLEFLPPDEAWYSKIVGWLLNQPKRNILFFKCLSVILSRGYVGFAKRLNSVLKHTWISKNELTNDSVVYQDNFLSELLSTYVQLRQLPVLIGKMLESLSKAQKLNVVLDSKMLWHQQFEQKLCENFLQLPQTTFIKVWGAINGALHKIAHRNKTGSLITVAPFCHLLSMLLSAISIVDLNITQSTRDSARQHLKMFNAEIISKLIQKSLSEYPENLPSLVELYWTCSELETLLNHYIAGDSNPIKFTRHNDDVNDDGFSWANLHPGIEKELWDNLLIHSENDKQLLYQITMMTFHGLRSQLLSQATNSEFINACTEWLCKQCLPQTTPTLTPRGVKDTWDKRSFSISAHNSHIAQFYLFCSNVPLMAEVLNQKQQTTFAQLLLQCRLTEETENCMTLGTISADFLQSTTLQELPTIQCAIINAVITETCSTMELKSHDLRSNIPTNSPMISAYQKLLETFSNKHCTDMSELSVQWHKNAFVDENQLICRNQEIYARLQHYNQIISTLPIEYLQTHEINCCQFYYLFVLCTTNANLKEGPSMRSTHWDAAKALSHASWEGFSKMIDISGTCVVEMVDFQQQLKFLEFFYSNISYNWKGVNFTERIVGTAIQNGQHLNDIQTFIENICPEVKSTELNENVLQSVVSQCNFVLNSVTKIILGSPHCGIQTSLVTLSHKLTSLITQHFSTITKNMDIYCNVLLAYQNVLLGKMLDSKNKKCFPKIVQGAVDVINDIQSSNLECIEYSASLLTCVCDEWDVCGKFMKDDFLFKLYKILHKQLKLAYVEEQKQEEDVENTEGDHSSGNNSVDDSLKQVTLAVLSKIPSEMYSTILEQALQDVNPIDNDINNLIVTLRLWLLLVQKLRIVDCLEIVHKSIAKILLKVSVIVGSHKCVDSAHDVHLLLVCYELQQEIVLTKIQDHIPDCMTAVTFNGLSLNFCEMNGREFVSLFTSIIKFTKKYLKRWPQNLNSLTPTYMAVVKSLLEGIMHHGDQSRVNENNYTEIIGCARLMTSLCKRISENKLQFKKVAFHLIVEYVYNIKKVTLHADVKECLLYAMYAILTLADKSTVKHLLVVLPTNLTYVFRNIQQDYEKYHRFKGEI